MSIQGRYFPATLLFAVTAVVAVCGAKPYAGGWNDGSRLAAVEAIADHGTLCIDDSVFVHPANCDAPPGIHPYAEDRPDLLRDGTKDKLFIAGRYYSDKPYSLSLVLAAAPLVMLQLGLNYRIGSVFIPLNMVAEYSAWPGGPFHTGNLTGYWRHTPAGLVRYAASMLFGKRGIVGHNLPLFLLIPAIRAIYRKPFAVNLELWTGLTWCAATWLLYAALSDNSSGACCSIRWFVPFLAPAWFVLAHDVLAHPERRIVFLALSLWGGLMASLMWWQGPWGARMVPGYWFLVAAALLTWRGIVLRRVGQPVTSHLPFRSILTSSGRPT